MAERGPLRWGGGGLVSNFQRSIYVIFSVNCSKSRANPDSPSA